MWIMLCTITTIKTRVIVRHHPLSRVPLQRLVGRRGGYGLGLEQAFCTHYNHRTRLEWCRSPIPAQSVFRWQGRCIVGRLLRGQECDNTRDQISEFFLRVESRFGGGLIVKSSLNANRQPCACELAQIVATTRRRVN